MWGRKVLLQKQYPKNVNTTFALCHGMKIVMNDSDEGSEEDVSCGERPAFLACERKAGLQYGQ